MITTVSALLFRIIQLILLPVAAIGYPFFVIKLIAYSRRSGTSATVLASLYTRYMQHKLGTRIDEPCYRLMKVLPTVSQLELTLTTAPTLLAHRLTRFVPHFYRYPYEGEPSMKDQPVARTTFYDMALARHLGGIKQLVILGAGFDTRCYRLQEADGIQCFEVDAPRTQAFKLEMLIKAGVDRRRVTYTSADFLKEDWFAKLVEAGFDPDKPSFFLWESVTMYLDRESVESTLRRIAGTAPGSVVALDYFSKEIIESRSIFIRYARAVINATREPWMFGIDNTPPARARVAEFLESCGLTIEEHHNFGQESGGHRALAGFATALVINSIDLSLPKATHHL